MHSIRYPRSILCLTIKFVFFSATFIRMWSGASEHARCANAARKTHSLSFLDLNVFMGKHFHIYCKKEVSQRRSELTSEKFCKYSQCLCSVGRFGLCGCDTFCTSFYIKTKLLKYFTDAKIKG